MFVTNEILPRLPGQRSSVTSGRPKAGGPDHFGGHGVDELPFARSVDVQLAGNRHAGIGDRAAQGLFAARRLDAMLAKSPEDEVA
jgi:hypothetical protein